jgi:hypothetical protein
VQDLPAEVEEEPRQLQQAEMAVLEVLDPAEAAAEEVLPGELPVMAATAALVMLLWFLGNWRYYGRALGSLLQ